MRTGRFENIEHQSEMQHANAGIWMVKQNAVGRNEKPPAACSRRFYFLDDFEF
jgi:hypothetical protein